MAAEDVLGVAFRQPLTHDDVVFDVVSLEDLLVYVHEVAAEEDGVLLEVPCAKVDKLLPVAVDVRQVLEMLGVVFERNQADVASDLFDCVRLVVHLRRLQRLEVPWEVD